MAIQATVRELLDAKDNVIYSIGPDATVFEALKVLSEAKIGALLVLERGKLVGVFSERDYARKIILEGRQSKDTQVRDIMTTSICHVTPDQTVKECMTLMNKNRIRHLPVMENDELVGVVSIGDIVRAILVSLLQESD